MTGKVVEVFYVLHSGSADPLFKGSDACFVGGGKSKRVDVVWVRRSVRGYVRRV